MMFFVSICTAQKSDTTNVNILHSTIGGGLIKGDTQLFRLVGEVQLEQNGTLMYCDSAYINQDANNVEAFGNVKIVQPGGTQVQSDYLRYIGNTKKAYLRGNVSLTDGKATCGAKSCFMMWVPRSVIMNRVVRCKQKPQPFQVIRVFMM
jgi:lipopolysaccharide assembly outer membrane protein LptD (OstA)